MSPEWKQKVGADKSVSRPGSCSTGGEGNEGVVGIVRPTPGAIGYVEVAYLLETDMTYAPLQDKTGNHVYANIATVAAAAATKRDVSSADFSIADAAGSHSYPISGYSSVMLYKRPADAVHGSLVSQLMNRLVTHGPSIAKTVDYVSLPESAQKQAEKILHQVEV